MQITTPNGQSGSSSRTGSRQGRTARQILGFGSSSPVPFSARPVRWDSVVVEVLFQSSGRRDAERLVGTPERVARRGRHQALSFFKDFLPSWTSRPSWTGRAKESGATKRPLRREHLGGTCASVPGHDGRPVGSLRRERQYRDRKASWRSVNLNQRKERHE